MGLPTFLGMRAYIFQNVGTVLVCGQKLVNIVIAMPLVPHIWKS